MTLYRYVGPQGQLREQGEKVLATRTYTASAITRNVANDRLRHMRIGYARVSKVDGSQSLDLQRGATSKPDMLGGTQVFAGTSM